MKPQLQGISGHMLDIGLGILSQAQRNLFYCDYNPRLDEGIFGVLQAAHACEFLIKAAIAQEHPLLIFEKIPMSSSSNNGPLDIQKLLDEGRTLQYRDLPERLWAVTGYKIEKPEVFKSFGLLRNTIQHFAVPSYDLRLKGTEFIYSVVDPILAHFWNHYAVEYCDLEEYETDFFEMLVERGVIFRYPEHLKEYAEAAIKKAK